MAEAKELEMVDDEMEVVVSKKSFSSDQLRKDLQIRDSDLDGCMTEQASLYGYYATLYAKAQYEADRAKNQIEVIKAKRYAALRNAKTGRGAKFTEAQLEAEVLRSVDVINAHDKANRAKMRATIIREGLEAFKQRRDMLVQKGKARLEDLKGELYLRGKTGEGETARQRMDKALRGAKDD